MHQHTGFAAGTEVGDAAATRPFPQPPAGRPRQGPSRRPQVVEVTCACIVTTHA